MRTCWLTRTGQPSCILFFAGWGMDPEPFHPIAPSGHDLLMFYDYRELERPDLTALLPPHCQRLSLLAWSMGVWVASYLLSAQRQHFNAAVAVNGTLTPIDDRCGIGVQAYEDMLATFSAQTLHDFYRNMFMGRDGLDLFLANRPQRPMKETRQELTALRALYLEHGPAEDIYTHKLVGSRDRIFPARAQVRSWGKEKCRTFKAPHFPFYGHRRWDDFLGEGE